MRLIIVSNRLPLTVTRKGNKFEYKETSGGLVTGLKAVKTSLPFLWIGNISGIVLTESEQKMISSDCWELYKSVPVFVSEQLNEDSYNGFCNGILWPSLHTFADDASFDFRLLAAYRAFNRQFAEAVLQHAQPGDTVWVHDYHLMLLPQMLRESMPDLRIGFFLHTPFSPADIFQQLPCASELVSGILGADLVGMHTPDYAAHFLDTAKALRLDQNHEKEEGGKAKPLGDGCNCEILTSINENELVSKRQKTELSSEDFRRNTEDNSIMNSNEDKKRRGSGIDSSPIQGSDSQQVSSGNNFTKIPENTHCESQSITTGNTVSLKTQSNGMDLIHMGRRTAVRALSIGIDPDLFRRTLRSEGVAKRIAELRRETGGLLLIVGVDRTDYIKGIPQRIRAFEHALATHPACFIQVCVPSRLDVPEYSALMETIYARASECNGRQSVPSAPFRLRAGSVPLDELCAIYAAADVLVVSSLMDGMNLVALEYIACQDGRGVLMLSEFAGCVATLPGAITFNPWNEKDTAEKLKQCMDMGEKEKKERFEINQRNVDRFTALKWAQDNIECLKSLHK